MEFKTIEQVNLAISKAKKDANFLEIFNELTWYNYSNKWKAVIMKDRFELWNEKYVITLTRPWVTTSNSVIHFNKTNCIIELD